MTVWTQAACTRPGAPRAGDADLLSDFRIWRSARNKGYAPHDISLMLSDSFVGVNRVRTRQTALLGFRNTHAGPKRRC